MFESMVSIALISDVHGNIPALEAVLKDIRSRGIKRIFCLGDLVGKGPEPGEAVDICRNECEKIVMGNWDSIVAGKHKPPEEVPERIQKIFDWYRVTIGIERVNYLGQLPCAMDFFISGHRVRLVHASPQGVFHRVFHNDSTEKHLAMFENTDFTGNGFIPDIVGYADIHFAYQIVYGNRILFNVGSVGNPLDQPLACYWILEGDYGSETPSPFSLSLVRLPYDIDLAVKLAYDSGMPEIKEWENELRTAVYRLAKANTPSLPKGN